jgi:16S rRNA (guanine527-N7)-methyltransferase
LATFLDQLETWNARLNLVGEHDRQQLVDRHLVDSLAAAPLLDELGTGLRVADVGSGAGLPGIPLAIAARTREMVLIEPRRKRASFLRAVRRSLPDLPLTVLERRADELSELGRGSFDAIVSRAALADGDLLRVGQALLREGGLLIAHRGTSPDEDARPAPSTQEHGLSSARIHRYLLPGPRRSFTLVVRERLAFHVKPNT